jgi:hypothetical protein
MTSPAVAMRGAVQSVTKDWAETLLQSSGLQDLTEAFLFNKQDIGVAVFRPDCGKNQFALGRIK